jgi:CHASE2 domain-containing sensor protein
MAKQILSNHRPERPAIAVFYVALTLLLGGVWGVAVIAMGAL